MEIQPFRRNFAIHIQVLIEIYQLLTHFTKSNALQFLVSLVDTFTIRIHKRNDSLQNHIEPKFDWLL
jgi:hypothetical protein